MKKRWKQITLAVTSVALVANPYTLKLIGIHGSANETYYSTDNDLYDKQLKEATDAVNKAKETWVEEDVKKAIDTVIQLPWATDYKMEEKDKLLDELYDFINNLSDTDFKARYGAYFVQASVDRVTESLIDPDYELATSLVSTLPEGNLKDKYTAILKATGDKMQKDYLEMVKKISGSGQTPPIDWSKMPSDAFAPYEDEDTGDYLPGYPLPEKDTSKPNPETLPEDNYTENTEYQTIGSKCYKVTTKTVEGKKPTVSKQLVTGTDATFCSVAVIGEDKINKPYDFSQVDPSPPGSGINLNGGTSDNSSYFGYNEDNSTNQENASKLTLQYTLDRTEKDPYFYETDMMVSKNGTITYQQQRDILFQLAIRSGGKAVEDKDRFLVLLENKIIVVQNQGDKIPVSSFDSILKGFKAQVKAMERTTGTE